MTATAKPLSPLSLPEVKLPTAAASVEPQVATVLSAIRTIAESYKAKEAIILADARLTAKGMEDALKPIAEEARSTMAGLLPDFDTYGLSLKQEADQLVHSAAVTPPTSDLEKARQMELAKIVGAMTPSQRAKRMEAWARGEDREQYEAVMNTHYSFSGLQERTWNMLREQETESRVDMVKRERLMQRAEIYSAVRRALDGHKLAYEDRSDREALKKKGEATVRRGDMNDAQKSAYISEHGLAAFKALPA
jgi:hypothetical protein